MDVASFVNPEITPEPTELSLVHSYETQPITPNSSLLESTLVNLTIFVSPTLTPQTPDPQVQGLAMVGMWWSGIVKGVKDFMGTW